MLRVVLAVLLTTFCAAAASYPKIEVFGGFSANKFFYSESTGETDSPVPNAASLFDFGADRHQGLDVSLTKNFNRYVGIKADYSMYFREDSGKTGDGLNYKVPQRPFSFLFGPEFKARNHTRLTPFVHTLFGVAHSRADIVVDELSVRLSHSRTGFAMAFGGGADFRLSARWSIRAMTDYNATFLGNPSPDESGRQNNIRLAVGVLFHVH